MGWSPVRGEAGTLPSMGGLIFMGDLVIKVTDTPLHSLCKAKYWITSYMNFKKCQVTKIES